MNSVQTNKLASYIATEAVLKATTETSDIAALPAKLTLLSSKLAEIHSLAGTQTQPTTGRTARRDELLEAMIETTLDVATAVARMADEQQLTELGQAVNVTRAAFRSARQSHRPWLAQRVHAAALEVLPQLADYGVTAATLDDLQARIEAAQAGLHQPRTTITAKRAATERLAALFAEVDALLEGQIDRLIFPLRKTSPVFYADYQAARSVVNIPGTRNPASTALAVTNPPATTPGTTSSSTPPSTGTAGQIAA